jgi:hypothetical protein
MSTLGAGCEVEIVKGKLLMAAMAWSASAAADEPETAGRATLALFPQGAERCYVAEIADGVRKPGQTLTSFMLYRLLRPDPAREEIDASIEEAMARDRLAMRVQWVAVLARFKGPDGFYHQTVSCRDNDEAAGQFTCNRECDGGGFAGRPRGNGLIADFDSGFGGLSLESACDPDEEGRDRRMRPEEAGGSVVLERRPIAGCLAADIAARPHYALDPMPLRERIAVSGWRCLHRTYDRAHLRKHPEQLVTALAVAIDGPVRVETGADGWRTTILDITLALKLRDGMKASRQVRCMADAYQFRCGDEFRLRRRDGASALLLAGAYGGEIERSGQPPQLNGLTLGADDTVFRLDARTEGSCEVQ